MITRNFVVVAALLSASCVTTERVKDRSPDPRNDLPELSADEKKQISAREDKKLASEHPLTVVDLGDANAKDPIVDVRIVFNTGSADDPAGKEGLAVLTADVMREATEKLDATALAETLFPWAAELDVQSDKDTTVFIGRVHKDFAPAFVAVMLDVIAHPRFDAADFQRKRDEQKSFLSSKLRTSADEALQREELEAAIYPAGHPYHHTPAGTLKALSSITLDDVRAFAAANFTRDRAVLGVAGAASPAVVAQLKSGLESLPFSHGARTSVAQPSAPDGSKLIIIEKPSSASAISLGYAIDLSRESADYPALKLAETWFGEHRSLIGHLFHSMREVRGLNYGDYAYVEHFVQEGGGHEEELNIPRRTQYFSMWIRPVEHKNREFALRQAAWELATFAKSGIPDDDSFERVKSYVDGYWRSKEQEPMRHLGYAIDRMLTHQPFAHDEMRNIVKKLTRAEVNAAIARHLRADKLEVVVVTQDAKRLADDLAKNTPSPLVSAAKPPPNIAEENKQIEAFDLHLAPTDIAIVPATSLFEE